ncbi:ABC transporter related protein [Deinococcus maricopensis DSM 21211]|uniref:ABC transporter related protein n=1 Tax=Deinococcus maricopensis (strain DSM 21211 / LMG 22137 / NRRL B-23946 / LB-34) TaxID=709986 RepID=E8UAS3_DEIML|nr:ABC transporter related protein [Deinococcus maricopensis DSM 21211]
MQLESVGVRVEGAWALQDVTFGLTPGSAWLLTGGNGAGKSTLLRVLRGEVAPTAGSRAYVLDGARRSSAVRALARIALVSPREEAFYLTRSWAQSVRDSLLAAWDGGTQRLWVPTPEAQARLADVAEWTFLTALLDRDVQALSHGQRRRVTLARALMREPVALLLDEFTDGLDAAARARLGEVVEGVAASGVAVVLATHRPSDAPRLAWSRLHLEGGRVARPSASPEAAPAVAAVSDALTGEVLVRLENAGVYRGDQLAVGPLSFTWRTGEHWLVTGGNGAGKSTLVRTLAGEVFPAVGGVVARPFLRRDTRAERARRIGWVSAEAQVDLARDWTGWAVVASGFTGERGTGPDLTPEQAARVADVTARLGVSDLLDRHADTLSQGQLKRLLLARATVHAPALLLLDEPFDFLDADARARLSALLAHLVAGGTHVLVVAHHASDAPGFLNRHLHLQ